MTSRILPLGCLALALAFAAWARLARLDEGELWVDDFLHVLPAQAMARGDGPVLPSGQYYGRGMTTTRLVRVSQAHVADPELAARLPSALFGVAGVLIFAAIAWRVGGPWVATWSVVLLGSYPVAVQQSRAVRFYTEQLALGLIALWFGWLVVREPAPARRLPVWLALAGAALAFAAAAWVQVTTLAVAAGFSVAIALIALDDVRRLGARLALRTSARVQAALAGVAAVVLVVPLARERVGGLLEFATFVPLWAADSYSPRWYYWHLVDVLPVLVALLPAIWLAVGVRSPRLAVYLGCWFGVPMLLHSFVLRFQSERYVLLAMPALFLAAAIGATRLAGFGYRTVVDRGSRTRLAPGVVRAGAGAMIGIAALVAIVTSPALTRARKMPRNGGAAPLVADWRAVTEVLRRIPGSEGIPVGSRDPLASMFYGSRVDFDIESGHLERMALDSATGRWRFARFGQGVIDYYSGLPTLTTPEAIRERYASRGGVLVVVDSAWVRDKPEGLVPVLAREGVELCLGRCGAMLVYHWRFTPRTEAAAGHVPNDTDATSSP